jgi:putative phage-type endonuclease
MSDQGTDAWKQERLGKVTASRIADMMARTKTGYGASRTNYQAELLVERLTGLPTEGYTNAAMVWGTETEPLARAAYEFLQDAEVQLVGFVPHPTIAMSGASPDGLVGDGGLVEIKCPNSATHLDTLLGGSIPSKYVSQMQWQMSCADRKWCDWVSFDPRMPAHMQLFVRRLWRDDDMIAAIEKEVIAFLRELDDKIAALDKLYGQQAA